VRQKATSIQQDYAEVKSTNVSVRIRICTMLCIPWIYCPLVHVNDVHMSTSPIE
jgi:hypothetical protein